MSNISYFYRMASKEYLITRKQSLIDACIQVYGTSALLFKFAKDNNLRIDSVVNIGDSLIYDDSLGVPKMKKKLSRNQNVIANNTNFIEFKDWFLPSSDELNGMYDDLHLFGVGGFSGSSNYWSSSENSATLSWLQSFIDGSKSVTVKSTQYTIRACRTFTDAIGAYSLRDEGPAGGLIFYIDGTTYYEAAPSDQSASQAWSNINSVLIGTTGTAIGTGLANTDAIIAQLGHVDSAAKLCKDLIIIN